MKRIKAKYNAHNPKSKELIYVPEKNKVRFRPSKQLKKFITILISEENTNQPLSDESLRSLLSSKYLIKVARRTVTKYREEAGIGSTRIRRFNEN